jgi:hypothetical protein
MSPRIQVMQPVLRRECRRRLAYAFVADVHGKPIEAALV